MRQRSADNRDMDDVLFRRFDALADRVGDSAGFAQSRADMAVAVANDDQRAPAHRASALGGLLTFVRADHALFQVKRIRIDFRQ